MYHCELYCILRNLTSFPTRRSSDLKTISDVRPRMSGRRVPPSAASAGAHEVVEMTCAVRRGRSEGERGYPAPRHPRDRKSTRLNSSHLGISYAVFCLKKKILDKTMLLAPNKGGDVVSTIGGLLLFG